MFSKIEESKYKKVFYIKNLKVAEIDFLKFEEDLELSEIGLGQEYFIIAMLLNERIKKGDIFIEYLEVFDKGKGIGREVIKEIEKEAGEKIFFFLPEENLSVRDFYNKSFSKYKELRRKTFNKNKVMVLKKKI